MSSTGSDTTEVEFQTGSEPYKRSKRQAFVPAVFEREVDANRDPVHSDAKFEDIKYSDAKFEEAKFPDAKVADAESKGFKRQKIQNWEGIVRNTKKKLKKNSVLEPEPLNLSSDRSIEVKRCIEIVESEGKVVLDPNESEEIFEQKIRKFHARYFANRDATKKTRSPSLNHSISPERVISPPRFTNYGSKSSNQLFQRPAAQLSPLLWPPEMHQHFHLLVNRMTNGIRTDS